MLALVPVAVLLLAAACGGGGGDSTPSPSPSPSPKPLTATGTIGYITPQGDFALMDANGSNQRALTQDGGVAAFSWSPDGTAAALELGIGSTAHVRVIKPDGSSKFELDGSEALWSPAGDRLALKQGSGIGIADRNGNPERVFEDGARPAWAPDGTRLAFIKLDTDGTGVPVIGDIATGTETPLSAGIEAAPPDYPIAWHPAGTVIAHQNKLYEPATGTTRDLPGTAVEWAPDGRTLLVSGVYSERDGGSPGLLLDVAQDFKNTIGLLIRLSAEDIPAQLFIQKWTDWTPDGRFLVYLDPEPQRERVRLYDTVSLTQQPFKNIAGERPDVSPDGTHVAWMLRGQVWVFPLDASTLLPVADGGFPAWQPGSQG